MMPLTYFPLFKGRKACPGGYRGQKTEVGLLLKSKPAGKKRIIRKKLLYNGLTKFL